MDNSKKPEIRFPGFTDDWEQRKLGELGTVEMNKRIFKNETTDSGDIPFYKIGSFGSVPDAFISRELFIKYKSKYPYPKKGDLLLSASGSIGKVVEYKGEEAYFQDSNIVWLNHKNTIDNLFLKQFYNRVRWQGLEGSTIKRLYNKNILETQIKLPSYEEQNRIGLFFKTLDDTITLHQRELEELKNTKKGFLQKMFPKEGEKIPEIRFPGFTDTWEQRKLGDISNILAGGTPNTSRVDYWSPKEIPWMSSGEINGKRIYNTNTMISKEGFENSSARWVKKNAILIALAGQGKTRGTVAITTIPLTTNQSIAAIELHEMNSEFVYQNLESRYEELRLISSGDGTRGGLNKKIISEVRVPFTLIEEQIKIGNFFKTLDNTIALHQQELEYLKETKKAFLQKMFV